MNLQNFVPLWTSEERPLLLQFDFEEKWRAFHTPSGRLMSCAHRGDRNELYPENTWEAFCSALFRGADILEADIRVTRDGIPVVMHDETLTRTTDLSRLRASGEIRLPKGDRVSDWTAAELLLLHPTMPDGTVTDCRIPTLEELILLAKDRCFLTLDKAGAFSFEEHVIPLLEKHNAWRTTLIPYEYAFDRVVAIQQAVKKKCGHYAPYFAKAVRGHGVMDHESFGRAAEFLSESGFAPVLRGGEYLPGEGHDIKPLVGKYRLYAESLREGHDCEDNWKQMALSGVNILMGNHNYALIDFVRRYNAEHPNT